MSNIVTFPAPQSSGAPAAPHRGDVGPPIPELISRFTDIHAKAKRDIGDVILMLELALRQAREVSRMMGDAGGNGFDRQIAILESQLEFARDETRKL
ncbi:hypothetical protein [Bradyrhizobium sp.]|uniref:hypothetical protein n=1 Tax=Bradyrhizobium sp. TaxID=376 RepID=UPI0025C41A31|nr:hypothetical protein [Bradyrhizobium sp.]